MGEEPPIVAFQNAMHRKTPRNMLVSLVVGLVLVALLQIVAWLR